jgi:hypothetical protein
MIIRAVRHESSSVRRAEAGASRRAPTNSYFWIEFVDVEVRAATAILPQIDAKMIFVGAAREPPVYVSREIAGRAGQSARSSEAMSRRIARMAGTVALSSPIAAAIRKLSIATIGNMRKISANGPSTLPAYGINASAT